MTGLYWGYNQSPTPKLFIGESGDQYSDVSKILTELKAEYGIHPLEQAGKVALTKDQTRFIVMKLMEKIDDLLNEYDPTKKLGLNSVTAKYREKDYTLFAHGSKKHRLIYWHIGLLDFLTNALEVGHSVMVGKESATTFYNTR